MFIPNAPKADYIYRAKLGDLFTRSNDAFGMYNTFSTIVRTGSSDPATWISISCYNGVAPGDIDADAENKYILETPWGDYTSTVVPGWDSSMECRLEIDQAKVTTSDCEEFRFEFDEIRFYIPDGEGGFDLVHTIAGNSINPPTGFDRRYCTVAHTNLRFFNPTFIIGSNAPDCSTAAFENSSVSNTLVPCVGGWKINGTAQLVVVPTPPTVPAPVDHEGCPDDLDCETKVAMQGFLVHPTELSWHIELYPAIMHFLQYGATQEIRCVCTRGGIPCGIPWIWEFTERDFKFYTLTSEIWSAPTYAGILDYDTYAASNRWCCGLSPIPEPTVETSSGTTGSTYAATWETLEGTWSDVSCYELIQEGACCPPTEEEPVDPPESPCYSEGNCCAYIATRRYTWDAVPCGDGYPDLAVFNNTETYKAIYANDGNLYCYGKMGSTAPWELFGQVTTHGEAAIGQHSIFVTRDKHLVIFYARTGVGLVETWSYDRGRTWSTGVVAVLNGAYPRIAVSPHNGVLRMARVGSDKSLRGTYQGPGDPSQSSVFECQLYNPSTLALEDFETADSTFDIIYAHDGLVLGSWTIFGESSTSDWVSSDNGRTWRRL